ncbi:hypothetical protein MLD38_018551 [Melastoma candidum]|uniref:Uncharacterized protein n=1 Tax=Melastoma candidum TaxID=119954 RepID=A0ACB9QXA8_9MYRT|nr:hypothetical protein MLD38_018551 [Melastoma candidum]
MSVSAAFLLPTPPLTPSPSLSPRHLHLHRLRPLRPLTAYNSLNAKPSAPLTPHILPPYLQSLQPYLVAQRRPIFLGYLFGSVSVLSLSRIVPLAGSLNAAISSLDLVRLRGDGCVLIALVLVRVVSNYLQQAFLWDAALNAVCEIRVRVYRRVLERDLGFFEGRDRGGVEFGDVAHRIVAEAEDVADTIYAVLNTVVPTAMQVAALSMQMVAISPSLFVISAAAIPPMGMVVAGLGERLRRISRRAKVTTAAMSAYLNEVLPAVLFVKANNAELCEITRFKRLAYSDRAARLRKRKMKALVPQVLRVAYVGALFVLSAGSLLVLKGSFDGSRLVSFVTSIFLLVEPIQDVGKAYNDFKLGEPTIERLFDLSKFKPKVMEKENAVMLDGVSGELSFINVSFKYGDELPIVLDRVSLHVRAGETVALVGPSGGGKTTLAKLLLRLYDPFSGHICLDNCNIQDIRLSSLRRHVTLVSQDITLFSGTVAENIGYKDMTTTIDMDRVKRAGVLANADEFVEMLPDGYETNIGPRGSTLSGGQKQRIAIARAIYQDPSVLILDEATSALDSGSEFLVREALQRMMENRTVLVIAHRLETVLMANRIFMLKDGKLQELSRLSLLGDHDDTLRLSGLVI